MRGVGRLTAGCQPELAHVSRVGRFHFWPSILLLGVALASGVVGCGSNSRPAVWSGTTSTPSVPATRQVENSTNAPALASPPSLRSQTLPPAVTGTGTTIPSDAARLLRNKPIQPRSYHALSEAYIAFVSTRDGTAEIYRMRADGSEQVRLTHNGRSNHTPTWAGRKSLVSWSGLKPDGEAGRHASYRCAGASCAAGVAWRAPHWRVVCGCCCSPAS